jgi:hypothetical protein
MKNLPLQVVQMEVEKQEWIFQRRTSNQYAMGKQKQKKIKVIHR